MNLQTHWKHTVQSIFIGKGQFHGDVYPNIDCALIVGITVILDEIKHAQSSSTRGGGR